MKSRRIREWSRIRLLVFMLAIFLVALQTVFSLLSEKSEVSRAFPSTNGQVVDSTPQNNSHDRLVLGVEEPIQLAILVRGHDDESHEDIIINHAKADASFLVAESETILESRKEENKQNDVADIKLKAPYEIRRPDRTLPRWAEKVDGLREMKIQEDKEICFVHIGKTAGSTMGCALGFRYLYPGASYVEGLLSRYTTHLFHNNINDCPYQASNYLLSVRNPLDRINSAHVYERRLGPGFTTRGKGQGMIYEECGFSTLNDLAEKGLAINGKSSALCKERAHKHIRGTEQYSFHTFYNYQYYYQQLNNSSSMYVVRSEHMIDDWNGMESLLGGRRNTMNGTHKMNPSASYLVQGDHYLSEASRRLLCRALCDEIQLYKKLLRESINLDEKAIAESLAELASSCPREARIADCSSNEPYSDLSTSPFEVRWPGYILPTWAKKIDDLSALDVPEDKRICFVHVGKTAGSTMGSALGFRDYGLNGSFTEGLMSRYTTNLFHNAINDCQFNTTRYLISVRHPLDRIKSSFVYERPQTPMSKRGRGQGKIHEECPFRTLNDLAELGLATSGNASDLCKQRAYNFIRGTKQYGFHAYFNYQYYYKAVNATNNNTIFVVRTEHMLEDWNTVEWMLGGERESMKKLQRVNPSEQLAIPGDDYLSDKSRRLLCEALCEEIQIYKTLLYKALNLNGRDVANSINELAAACPLEASSHSCKGIT